MVPPAQSPKVPDSGILYPGAERCNCVHKIAYGDPGGGQTMYVHIKAKDEKLPW